MDCGTSQSNVVNFKDFDHSRWTVYHAECPKVTTGESEQSYNNNVNPVTVENRWNDRRCFIVVAEHHQRNEDETTPDTQVKLVRVLRRLEIEQYTLL